MKHLGFNAVIFTLILSAGLGLYREYMRMEVNTGLAEISKETEALLVFYAPDCNNVDLLKAYALDGVITIDEGHSLIAVCESTAWKNATPRERAQRVISKGLAM